MKLFLITFLSIIISGCSSEKKTEMNEVKNEREVFFAKNFSKEELAKFTISAIMFQPPKIMTTKTDGENIIVSYIRPSDKKAFSCKVKFEGSKIIWATVDGRWRDAPEDEEIIFIENGNKVSIIQKFDDGSMDSKEFSK